MGRKRIIDLYQLNTPEDTLRFGSCFATQIKQNQILALKGDLGAGKTTFVKGLLMGLNISDTAQSPTFTYLQLYEGKTPVYHFDLYRLRSEQDFLHLGFDEFFNANGLTVIEWPEKIAALLPKETLFIEFTYDGKGRIAKVNL